MRHTGGLETSPPVRCTLDVEGASAAPFLRSEVPPGADPRTGAAHYPPVVTGPAHQRRGPRPGGDAWTWRNPRAAGCGATNGQPSTGTRGFHGRVETLARDDFAVGAASRGRYGWATAPISC